MKVIHYFIILSTLLLFVACQHSESALKRTMPDQSSVAQKKTQNRAVAAHISGSSFKKEWAEVRRYEKKDLPRSAMKVVSSILQKAKHENNTPEIVKALMYQIKYESAIGEQTLPSLLVSLKKEMQDAQTPTKELLHSLYAQLLHSYFIRNRYRFYHRTATDAPPTDDIETWDLRTMLNNIAVHYNKSVEQPEVLQKIAVNEIDSIVVRGTKSRSLRPTLFDFLAHRAIDFFMNDESSLPDAEQAFEIDRDIYFAPAEQFVSYALPKRYAHSLKYNALHLLQQLTRFHLHDSDKDALIDIELKRLHFVFDNSVSEGKEALYLAALRRLEKKSDSPYAASMIRYTIAAYRADQGNKWVANSPFTAFRLKKKEAKQICEQTIAAYPQSEGALLCGALISELTRRALMLRAEKTVVPDRPFFINVAYRNIGKLYFKLVPYRKKYQKILEDNNLSYTERYKKLFAITSDTVWDVSLPDDGDLQHHVTAVNIPAMPAGRYFIFAATTPDFSFEKEAVAWMDYTVSRIDFAYYASQSGTELTVTDRESGVPIRRAAVSVLQRRYNSKTGRYDTRTVQRGKSDKNGRFRIKSSLHGSLQVSISHNGDTLTAPLFTYRQRTENRAGDVTYFFTDRSLYRPGQTIHFKGIMLRKNKFGVPVIRPRAKTTVTFFDTNRRKIAQTTFTSNRYGSFSGSFVAPEGVLNGTMRISDRNGSVRIRVEEYKRPHFKISLTPPEKNAVLNERVTMKGSAFSYAGAPLVGAKVTYTVTRETFFPYSWRGWWFQHYQGKSAQIAHGTVETDQNGNYFISFNALPDRDIPADRQPSFHFFVRTDVTDSTGETHSASRTVSVGYTSMQLSVAVPQHADINEPLSVAVTATDLNGTPVHTTGSIVISRLAGPKRMLRPRVLGKADRFILSKEEFVKLFPHDVYANEDDQTTWPKAEQVATLSFDTAAQKTLPVDGVGSWKEGVYVLEATGFDDKKRKVSYRTTFSVFNAASTNNSARSYGGATLLTPQVKAGKTARVLLESGAENVTVFMDIIRPGHKVERRIIPLNRSKRIETIRIREADRGGVGFRWMFRKDNRLFSGEGWISVPWDNKELTATFTSFRDRLKPGEHEQWTITLRGPRGEKVAAEMLATMYDASLDAILPHTFSFFPFPMYEIPKLWVASDADRLTYARIVAEHWNTYTRFSGKRYDRLDLFDWYPARPVLMRSRRMQRRSEAFRERDISVASEGRAEPPMPVGRGTAQTQENNSVTLTKASDKSVQTESRKQQADVSPQARKNLQETAFFFPHLMTNANGDIVVSFTVPEALTKWKMLGVAHTKDLKTTVLTKTLVTQKELMVTPNVPRFLREGDRVVIAAKITNMTGKSITGTANLTLFDAATGKQCNKRFAVQQPQQSFAVQSKGSVPVLWEITVPDGVEALTWKITAAGKRHSDGEQAEIPIVPNRMMVTESLPLFVNGNQSKKFVMKKLVAPSSKTAVNYRLTLEYTSNPVWYAVQALPYLMEYPHECSEQLFSRYYANSVASHIIRNNPQIERLFKQWKDSPAELSNLQKNQQLKSIVLEETPWVVDALNEQQHKKELARFFDYKRIQKELETAREKLERTQGGNGGWPWFAGMPESRFISQLIVAGLGKMDRIEGAKADKKRHKMERKGVAYIDNKMRADFDRLKALDISLDTKHITPVLFHYLYARSFFPDIPLSKRNKEAFDYWIKQAAQYWPGEKPYRKGLAALALFRFGHKKQARDIIASLKENAVFSEELGMYWKENVGGYYWYQAPIETEALLIAAFSEVAKDEDSVGKMKRWLLKTKQVRHWPTTTSTVEAVYALLFSGDKWLTEEKPVSVTVGTETVDPAQHGVTPEAGSGHFTVSWEKEQIVPAMGKVRVSNPNKHPAWGALYYQYFEQLDNITPHQTPLSLQKQLFVKRQTANGQRLEPLTDNTVVHPGDVITVKLILRVDRDMEYIHLKDMRPAGTEPISQISTYAFQDGLYYYKSPKDASTHFFIARLPKGTYLFEYDLRANLAGTFSAGIATIQCMYAPEFGAHSEGMTVTIR